MGNAVARKGNSMAEGNINDHIDVYPNGSDWNYGKVDATVSGTINTGSSNVYVNGAGVARRNDQTIERDDYNLGSWDYYEGGQHINATGQITGGSSTVYANGVALARVGDTINTHANTTTTINQGSSNVFSG